MTEWQPHFDIDFTRGRVGEELVGTFLAELEGSKIEVKTDYRAGETGNVYVETWQFSESDMSDRRQSGINVTEADWYCFASPTGDGFVAIRTETLKLLLRHSAPPKAFQPIVNAHSNGSEGRLVKMLDILRQLEMHPN